VSGPVCRQCGVADATCLGAYEGASEKSYACNGCCGHGNEDGRCEPLVDLIIPAASRGLAPIGPVCTCGEDGWCPVHHVPCACADPLGLCLNACICAGDAVRDAVDEHRECSCRERCHDDVRDARADRDIDERAFEAQFA
jgi:hypothetical protein